MSQVTGLSIAVFQLNVEGFPDSSNVYDSLAEAYMTAGKDEVAIENYERCLELEPDNSGAKSRIEWIRESIAARKNPAEFSKAELRKLAGRYGPFDVSFSNGDLYASADMLKQDYRLIPMSKEEFMLEGMGVYRLQFVFDDEGHATKLVGFHANGNKNEADRNP